MRILHVVIALVYGVWFTSSGGKPYAVNYRRETCDCPDALRHPNLNCKHVFAVGIHRAKRRHGVATLMH
jgi:hypothetical protein